MPTTNLVIVDLFTLQSFLYSTSSWQENTFHSQVLAQLCFHQLMLVFLLFKLICFCRLELSRSKWTRLCRHLGLGGVLTLRQGPRSAVLLAGGICSQMAPLERRGKELSLGMRFRTCFYLKWRRLIRGIGSQGPCWLPFGGRSCCRWSLAAFWRFWLPWSSLGPLCPPSPCS